MSIDRYTNGSYVNVGYGRLESGTDTITTLPKTLYADGQSASAVIKGNLSQSGTPTPASPIYPSETGDRTGNLFDYTTATFGKYIDANGVEQTSTASTDVTKTNHSDFIAITPNTVYTMSGSKYGAINTTFAFCWYDADKNFINRAVYTSVWADTSFLLTATSPMNAYYTIMNYSTANQETVIMNVGSTALPYIPYGYKLDIKSGSTTTPVYLGEVQSTRQIKKLVLDGTENWEVFPVGTGRYFRYTISSTVTAVTNVGMCSHYKRDNVSSATINTDIFTINAPSTGGNGVVISPSDITLDTTTDFKAYLAQQYAAGTPVCVWYVLATPQTTTLNEPIRKIGDYADSVSVTGIPTTGTAEQFDVDTTLKPSEVDLTYHGWHDYEPLKRENGQWV